MKNIDEKNKNEEFLEKIKEKGLKNVEFKKEYLGTLEFELEIMTKNFRKEPVIFKIDRMSSSTFMKITEEKDELKIGQLVLSKFIAHPAEARDIEFFNLDMDSMITVIEVIQEFQNTPSLFIENFGKNEKSGTA